MRYSSRTRSIQFFKANTAKVLSAITESREPVVITQNGKAKAVLQDIESCEETQEAIALLKVLALGNQEVGAGRVTPVKGVIARLRKNATV